ncbi:MAG: hypothetical protein ACYC6Y_10230 [Thermoguttaceae bacterium]
MSRRKKEKDRRPAGESQGACPGPVPDPPRPNRPLLAAAILLTLLWIGALVAMAVWA